MPKKSKELISKLNKVKVSIVVFGLSTALGIFIFSKLNAAEEEAKLAHTLQITNSYASSIEKVLSHALSSTHALAVMVRQGKGQVISNYTELAQYMLPMYKGVYALSIAPNGIMRQIEPAFQNKLVKDHDLFEGKDREKEIKDIKEGELKFIGPFKLIQGPQGAIGILPVFLNNDQGEKYFWGYTVVSLKFPDTFSDVQLAQLEQLGYAYEFSGTNRFDGKKEIIQRSQLDLKSNYVEIPIELHGNKLVLKVSNLSNPISVQRIVLGYIMIFLGSILMAWLAYSLLKLNEQRVQLNIIAMIDPLTNLPNRRLLSIKLDRILSETIKDKSCVVCYLDLDGFKTVNDQLGHAAGDQLLKIISERLKGCIRQNDVIARVGGDEFVLVLVKLENIEEANFIMTRVIDVVNQPINLSGKIAKVSASLGAAVYKTDGQDAEHLLRVADQAMYHAKNSGKNRFFFAQNIVA